MPTLSSSLYVLLIDAADEEGPVFVWTFEVEAYRSLQQSPGNAVHFLELLEILFVEMVPIAFRRELFKPVVRCGLIRKHRDSPGVFHRIRQPAALSNDSEPVLIIFVHIFWINCK